MVRPSVFNIALLCALAALVAVQGMKKVTGECYLVCGDERGEASGVITVCLPAPQANCSICRFYENKCPDIQECSMKSKMTVDGRCRICDDEVCAYDEQALKVGDQVGSKCGSQECMCQKDGTLKCTQKEILFQWKLCHENV
ncbi:uncharacterized protein [Argopecten irradians]|uniref:uncharacterized protein n=1 Tax=Argopecten irradians TaxID=31199 RepID=UPI00371FE85D